MRWGLLAALPLLGGWAHGSQLADEQCPPAPNLVVDGTVIEVETPDTQVRVRVEAVLIGTAGDEVTFQTARSHRVGDRGRFELHGVQMLSVPPAPIHYTERDCYHHHPTSVRPRGGCAGCGSGGEPGLFMVAALLALMRARRAVPSWAVRPRRRNRCHTFFTCPSRRSG